MSIVQFTGMKIFSTTLARARDGVVDRKLVAGHLRRELHETDELRHVARAVDRVAHQF